MSAERDIDRDAARYRWLRDRLKVRTMEALSGRRAPGLEVRLGCDFFDTVDRYRERHAAWSDELDAAIDAAIEQENIP